MSQIFPEPEPESGLEDQPTQIQPPVLEHNPASANPRQRSSSPWQATFARQIHQGQQGATKWLYDAGSWIFGLLTVTAVILSMDLILLGSPDHATLIAGLAIAIALPFNLAGLWLAQYLKDPAHATPTPAKKQLIESTGFITMAVGTILTFVGLGSAFWRISWVVTILFLLATVVGLWLISRVRTETK